MSPDDLAALNDQIAGMARAGLPLDQGLAGLARDMGRGRLKRVTEQLVADLRAGRSLPEAIDRQRGVLPPYYAGLVTAGVRTGRIGEVLTTLTTYSRTLAATRAVIIDSLFYPAVVILFAGVLFAVLAFGILPQFKTIFDEFGLMLPLFTRFVLGVGAHPEWTFGVPLGLLGLLAVAWLVVRRTEPGRRAWARAVYAVPVVGTLVRAARMAAFAELLAVLVEYELPLPEAFRLAADACSDPVMAHRARAAAAEIEAGEPVGAALRGRGLVPEWVAWMTGAGADRGSLGPALRQIAAVYRRQVDARAVLLRTVLPPFLIIGTAGVLTGAFLVALMLPLLKLLEGLSK